MPISTPYRPRRHGCLRPRQGGVAIAIAVVALAALLTLPAAFAPATDGDDHRPFAQRIHFKKDDRSVQRNQRFAWAPSFEIAV